MFLNRRKWTDKPTTCTAATLQQQLATLQLRLGPRGLGMHHLRLSTASRLDLRQVQRTERLRLAPKPQTGPVLKWVGSTCLPYRSVSTSWRRPMASLWRWSRLCGTHPACPELPRLQITRVSGNKLALPDSWIRHLLLCFPLNCIWIDLLYLKRRKI